jgi:RNA polymerase sigma factor (sigma-70 family)
MPTLRPIDCWFLSHVLPYEARFLSAARRLLRDSHEAHDLVQEVFTRLFVLKGWAAIDNPRAYVLRMLKNLAIERIRRARIVEFQRLADVEAARLVDEGPDPFRTASAHEQLRRIWAVLDEMPPEYRSVLIQRRLDDEPISQIARRMNMSVSTLEKRLARAIYLLNVGLQARGVVLESEFCSRDGGLRAANRPSLKNELADQAGGGTLAVPTAAWNG